MIGWILRIFLKSQIMIEEDLSKGENVKVFGNGLKYEIN